MEPTRPLRTGAVVTFRQRTVGARCVMTALLVLLAPPSAWTQEDKNYQVKMTLEPFKDKRVDLKGVKKDDLEGLKKDENSNNVPLRANTATKQTLFLSRSTTDVAPDVKLILKDAGGETVIAEASFEKKKDARLVFKKVKDDKIVLKDPPFQLLLNVGRYSYPVAMEIHEPKDFFEVTLMPEAQRNKLHFKIKMKSDAPGPRESPVQLILGPDFEEVKQGVLQNFLTAPGEVELFAEDVALRKNKAKGAFSLKVDGYERAFNYSTNLKTAPERLDKDNRIAVALVAPEYMVPSEKLPLRLEANGPLHKGHQLVVGLDRAGSKNQFQLKPYAGLRRQLLELSFTKDGDLLWKNSVQDWQDEFNAAGVFNPVFFKVFVKDGNDNEVKFAAMHSSLGGTEPAKEQMIDALYARVVLDATPPINVRFEGVPEVRGKILAAVATADPRSDRQAPIEKAFFFLGKPTADGKIGPDAMPVEGIRFGDANEKFFAEIPLPQHKEGQDLFLSVQFVTKTGLAAFAKPETIRLLAPPLAAKFFKIKGVVRHGDAPEPDVNVGLFDAKGLNLKRVVKANEKGEFVFDKVDPGRYVISAGTTYPKTVGQTDVVVSSKDEMADVKLLSK